MGRLADEPLLIMEGMALLGASLGLILAAVARARARRSPDRIARIFWDDVSRAGYIWAVATMLVLVGALGDVEGLRVPVWLLLSIIVGVVCLVITRLRWALLGRSAERTRVDDPARPEGARLASRSWEVAMLSGGGGALLVYGLSAAGAWGHPIHWLAAGIGAVLGYAVGLILATPRYTVKRDSS